jgi:hypothetical protein
MIFNKSILASLFFAIFISLGHCGFSQTNYKKQTGGYTFTMSIPDYMEKVYDLNEAAALQYASFDKEAYVIVIVEEKEALSYFDLDFENPTDFLQSFVSEYKATSQNRKVSPILESTEDGINFAQARFSWTDDDLQFEMLITVAETENKFYNILCWTLSEFTEDVWFDFMEISKTIRE